MSIAGVEARIAFSAKPGQSIQYLDCDLHRAGGGLEFYRHQSHACAGVFLNRAGNLNALPNAAYHADHDEP